MPQNKLPEVVDDIEKWLFPNEKPYRAGRILWIIRQYLKYVFLAAIHGHTISRKPFGTFELTYRFWSSIPWSLRKRFVFSSKAFGYEFRITYFNESMKRYGYYFNADGRWKSRIRKIVETDKVYELIPGK